MPSVLLVSDFDGTLTKKDTTHLSFRSTRKFLYGSHNEQKKFLQEVKDIGELYMKSYKTLVDCLLQDYKKGTSPTLDELGQFLNTIDQFNLDSRDKLAKQKYFDDFVYESLEELIKEIEFNTHAIETLQNLQKQDNVNCKILSVNWFPELLNACVKGIISKESVITSSLPLLRENQVEFGQVSTALGKGEWLRKWNKEYQGLSVYLGDTLTDLSALLEANYGIIFGCDKKLMEVTDIFQIPVVPLLSLLNGVNYENLNNSSQNFETGEKCLYSTTSWLEVEKLVISLLQFPDI